MLRNRIIFSLIYSNGNFMQSRNFKLQKVGDIKWLKDFYKFHDISFSLDELVVLDSSRNTKNLDTFSEHVKELSKNVYLPIAAGGGVNNVSDAELLFHSGADKIVLNTLIFENNEEVNKITSLYGSQSVVASIDYKYIDGVPKIYTKNGSIQTEFDIYDLPKIISSSGVGEVLLNSIDADGTGFGYDIDLVSQLSNINIPIIISGGAGNSKHFMQALDLKNISAVATANLLNFVGDGLPLARKDLIKKGYNIADHLVG